MLNYHTVGILESEGNYKPEYILGIESLENDNTSRKKSRSHQIQTGFIRFPTVYKIILFLFVCKFFIWISNVGV